MARDFVLRTWHMTDEENTLKNYHFFQLD